MRMLAACSSSSLKGGMNTSVTSRKGQGHLKHFLATAVLMASLYQELVALVTVTLGNN